MIFRPLVEARLGVKIVKATTLKEKMQTTIELEMDFFYLVLTDTGEKFILHLEFELKRYINQLVMISRLRKIESLTIKITEEMPIHFDYETDTLYLKGNEKGYS